MNAIYICIGTIGSGKSYWAREFVEKNSSTKIVSADNFREMLNGKYKYEPELDEIINKCMVSTIKHLLVGGYNVIVDVCNMTSERRQDWTQLPVDNRVAVLFPWKDRQWHVKNRLQKNHCEGTDWGKIYDGNLQAFEPINENEFDEIIKVEEWSN